MTDTQPTAAEQQLLQQVAAAYGIVLEGARTGTTAAPAEPSGAAPAAAGPHPDIPDRPGVLGRALLDRRRDLWPSSGDGWWREPGRSKPDRRAGRVWTTVQIEREYGPVREVLLVPPAAGRVLDAVGRWRDQFAPGPDPNRLPRRGELIAAWDALAGASVAAVELEIPCTVDGCQRERPCPEHDPAEAAPDCQVPGAHGPVCARRPGQLLCSTCPGRPAEPAPEPWRCVRCGSTRWVGWRRGPEHEGWPRRAQCVPCGRIQEAPRTEPAPEPDSGTECREALCRDVEADRDRLERDGPLWAREKITHLEDRIADLRADRNVERAVLAAALERDAARADRDRLARELRMALAVNRQQQDAYRGSEQQRDAARAELAELQQLFDLQWRRMGDATALWRAEAPQERALLQPDLGALLEWLMARADAARAELDTARRDAAAGTLAEAARELRENASGVAEAPSAQAMYTVANVLDKRAGEIRAGTRPVPGSPQPAEGGGQDG